jgi:hypothetical protein
MPTVAGVAALYGRYQEWPSRSAQRPACAAPTIVPIHKSVR